MNITIIKEDNLVIVDGKGLNFPLEIDQNIWAIHWEDNKGEIEYVDGTFNKSITDFTEFQYIVDEYNKEDKRLNDEESQRLIDEEASKTYSDRRVDEYPSLSEQADLQYWDHVNGTTVWFDTITAIKAKYPKTV